MSETDEKVNTSKFFLETWEEIVKDFEKQYAKYFVHDADESHTTHPNESEPGEWEVFVHALDESNNPYKERVVVCANKEIAIEEAVHLLWHDSDGAFFEHDLIFGSEMEKFAKVNNATEQLHAMQNKLRTLVTCPDCFDPWWTKDELCKNRVFVNPRPATRNKKRRIGYEDSDANQ